jgi:hypothetical protein
MNNRKFIIFFILLMIALPYTYGGCVVVFSSGGTERDKKIIEDDSSGGFIGVTSQATINSENAWQLTGGAFAGSLTSVEGKSSKLNQSGTNYQIDAFRALRFPLMVGHALCKIEISPALIIFSRTNPMTENGKIEGSCGGGFSYTLKFYRKSEKFSGSLSFEEYCDGANTFSGDVNVYGTFEDDSGVFETANFSFDDLSDASHSLNGEILIDFSDIPILATFTAFSTDRHTGQVYWIKNYSMNLIESVGHVEVEIFGTFYLPDYGHVALKTSQPFVLHDTDDWPTSGQLVIQGASDTTAQITAIDQLHCRIEADTKGNGIFDWDSGILYWSNAPSESYK